MEEGQEAISLDALSPRFSDRPDLMSSGGGSFLVHHLEVVPYRVFEAETHIS